ncbi:MAG: phage tail protein [Gammaproteobacteria bacterium]|nr:phage tail protein [Gammaproteobacteria bacterium]
MPTHNNAFSSDVIVRIGGKEHRNWKSYSIDSDFLIPADAFDFDIGVPAEHGVVEDFSGLTAEVEVAGEKVLTGIVDDCNHSLSKSSRSLTISGRDNASILLDCSCPLTNLKGLDMMAAITRIAKPLGIIDVIHQAEKNPNVDKVDIEPGMTAWDAIINLANFAGLHAWFDPNGVLVIGGADYSNPPVATLVLNRNDAVNNVISINLETSMRDRYSEVTFLGQSHTRVGSRAQNKLKWVYKDPSIPFHKPKTVVLPDAEDLQALKKSAKKYISDWRLSGFTLTASVAGHATEDGVLWTPGQRVHVVSDEFGIDDIYFLMGRTFKKSKFDGTRTELRLKEDGVWTPDAYKSKAEKAQKRKGKRKASRQKSKRELIIV